MGAISDVFAQPKRKPKYKLKNKLKQLQYKKLLQNKNNLQHKKQLKRNEKLQNKNNLQHKKQLKRNENAKNKQKKPNVNIKQNKQSKQKEMPSLPIKIKHPLKSAAECGGIADKLDMSQGSARWPFEGYY